MPRVTQQMVQDRVADLKAHGIALGIEGAEYWAVENPYGPHGLHFLEVHHDDGRWVSGNTKLGTYYWPGPAVAHRELTAMCRALHAARLATESGDRHSELHQAGTV